MAGSPPLVLALCSFTLPTATRTPVGAEEGTGGEKVTMSAAAKVAVVGCGISGALCASMLAGRGLCVTVFESGRGPGGRMSQRRELAENGELFFDHGAPFFTISNEEVMGMVNSWEVMGLVSEWKENFGCFDLNTSKFVDFEKGGSSKRYVGVPGMNSICKALCHEPGVETKFQTTVGKLNWLEGRNLWLLNGMDGKNLGQFDSIVVSDKNVFSSRYTGLTGQPPPLEMSLIPELAGRLQDIPVHSCFALMLAFSEPLTPVHIITDGPSQSTISHPLLAPTKTRIIPSITQHDGQYTCKSSGIVVFCGSPESESSHSYGCTNNSQWILVKGFSFKNSNILSWAFCDTSKPGRFMSSSISECWVLHSTADYAADVISKTGLKKPTTSTLVEVAEDLLQEFERTGLVTSRPFFMKAHRWGSAFPAISVGGEGMCLWDKDKRLAICGDFCVNPSVEGAMLSSMRAASKIAGVLSCL